MFLIFVRTLSQLIFHFGLSFTWARPRGSARGRRCCSSHAPCSCHGRTGTHGKCHTHMGTGREQTPRLTVAAAPSAHVRHRRVRPSLGRAFGRSHHAQGLLQSLPFPSAPDDTTAVWQKGTPVPPVLRHSLHLVSSRWPSPSRLRSGSCGSSDAAVLEQRLDRKSVV